MASTTLISKKGLRVEPSFFIIEQEKKRIINYD